MRSERKRRNGLQIKRAFWEFSFIPFIVILFSGQTQANTGRARENEDSGERVVHRRQILSASSTSPKSISKGKLIGLFALTISDSLSSQFSDAATLKSLTSDLSHSLLSDAKRLHQFTADLCTDRRGSVDLCTVGLFCNLAANLLALIGEE